MKKYLHYEESEIQDELNKINEDKKIIKPEGIDFFGINEKGETDVNTNNESSVENNSKK